jgi:hypothetical protein
LRRSEKIEAARAAVFLDRSRSLADQPQATLIMPKDRYSLRRLIKNVLQRKTATGFELDVSNELSRSISVDWEKRKGEPGGYLVPSGAFDGLMTRDVTVGG